MDDVRTALLGFSLVTLACGTPPGDSASGSEDGTSSGSSSGPSSSGAESTGGGSVGMTDSATSEPTSSGGPDATSTTLPDPTTGMGETTGGSEGSSGGESTGGPLMCDLVDQACAIAEAQGDLQDCGVALLADTVDVWMTVVDCALTASGAMQPFKAVFWLQGIDSTVGVAYVGLADNPYRVTSLFYDSDPCGGGGCGPVVSQAECMGIAAAQGCVVEPGNPCLECEKPGESTQLCGPP